MRKTVVFFLLLIAGVLVGCNQEDNNVPQKNKTFAYKIDLVESEQYVEPYHTRIIVTPEFLRYDDGEGAGDYVLLDRKKNVIYSVNVEDETVMAVHEKKSDTRPPFKLDVKLEKVGELTDAPAINNQKAVQYKVVVNGRTCYNMATIKDLMPEAMQAFQQFARLSASDGRFTFGTIPADMHDACEMTMTTFFPVIHLQSGFPVMEWGRSRQLTKRLVDYDLHYHPDPSLFVLPDEKKFQHYTVQEMREGKVKFRQ